jgi:AcrR family transcriptional regulator
MRVKKKARFRALGSKGAYECGDTSRRKILESAIQVFGEVGYRAGTTRQIAARAGVNLAGLRYYFGRKEDIYRACAEHIADYFSEHLQELMGRLATNDLSQPITRDEMLNLLGNFLESFVDNINDSPRHTEFNEFTTRAAREHSAAFDILYQRVFTRTIDTAQKLFCTITKRPNDDVDSRIALFCLIGGAMIFRTLRPYVLRSLGWKNMDGARLELVTGTLRKQLLLTIEQLAGRDSLAAPASGTPAARAPRLAHTQR